MMMIMVMLIMKVRILIMDKLYKVEVGLEYGRLRDSG